MEINVQETHKWIDEKVEEDSTFPNRKMSMKNYVLYYRSYTQTRDDDYKEELRDKMDALVSKITTIEDVLNVHGNGLWGRFQRRINGLYLKAETPYKESKDLQDDEGFKMAVSIATTATTGSQGDRKVTLDGLMKTYEKIKAADLNMSFELAAESIKASMELSKKNNKAIVTSTQFDMNRMFLYDEYQFINRKDFKIIGD